ncbi:MAG: hypothetical protein DDT40_01665 [candidate division WS2 bacterium]|nr:hypothetical protein [Candidatus Psychracetigena formicireducens]
MLKSRAATPMVMYPMADIYIGIPYHEERRQGLRKTKISLASFSAKVDLGATRPSLKR